MTLSAKTIKLGEIVVSDPFIHADRTSGCYYLYRQTKVNAENPTGGVEAFKSRDLKNWSGPFRVLTVPEDNWITGSIWAPEMHCYNGRYYMFATVNSPIRWKGDRAEWPAYTYRATQTFVSDSPEGPFVPVNKFGPIPPMEYMTLDGTLWIQDDVPYMVYCHEWVQAVDGTIEYIPMEKDLSSAAGSPSVMFHASSAKWSTGDPDRYGTHYVTDGPFLYTSRSGELLMVWSSYCNGKYAVGVSRSVTGRLSGPWIHEEEPIFSNDGGHAMIFHDFDGNLRIVFHTPNFNAPKRPVIYELTDCGTTLRLGECLAK